MHRAAILAKAAKYAGVRFINANSTHALENRKKSVFSQSERDRVKEKSVYYVNFTAITFSI